MSRSVLVIDDEESIRHSLKGALSDEGHATLTASSGAQGLDMLRSSRPDVVLLDIWMTEMDGLETLKKIKAEWPDQAVIMMSGHGTIETAVKATKMGAYDFIEKPLSLERLLVLLHNAFNAHDLSRENVALKRQVQKHRQLIGDSSQMVQIRDLIRRVAPTMGSVLITGENGTGKELVAQSIHAMSPRHNKPFIEVNCAAIPEELIESELFGHEKGSFTGATQMRRGKFDLAHNGTLFLDEIGDMSLKTQAKVLRILQEQKFERVGGTQTISVDVRVIAATNKDLKAEIQRNRFREDLFYRLNVIPIVVPPLRERNSDIPLLVDHFAADFSHAYRKAKRAFSGEAYDLLKGYSWPGNVRELKNLIERLIILATEIDEGQPVSAATLLAHMKDEVGGFVSETTQPRLDRGELSKLGGPSAVRNLRDARQEFEREFIIKTLKEQDWNISKTATVLGIERSHLHRKIKSYGIDVGSTS
jgi:two-component system, NtrC family, nitrogen regulation response regulator NtrX